MLIFQSERAAINEKGDYSLRAFLFGASRIMKSARSPNLRIVPAAIISLESNEITAGDIWMQPRLWEGDDN